MIPIILSGSSQEVRSREKLARFPDADWVITHIAPEKTSILIAQIHATLESMILSAPLPRLIWIEEAQMMTVPAQNALLKILEEPPQNTQFLLTTDNASALLATIRSRCTVITLPSSETGAPTMSSANLTLLKSALKESPGNRIQIADSLGRKREELVVWCQETLRALAQITRGEQSSSRLRILATLGESVTAALTDLQANVSPSLVMQNLFLSLPHTHS